VYVDVLYEPPQESTASSCSVLTTPEAQAELTRAHEIATALGLRRVGWAFSHTPRAADQLFTASELTKLCGEAATSRKAEEGHSKQRKRDAPKGGLPKPSPFLCCRFRAVLDDEKIDGDVTAEAYEATPQCEELAARAVLKGTRTPGHVALIDGMQLKAAGEMVDSADASYLVSRIHDMSRPYTSGLRSVFHIANRGASIRKLHLKSFLQRQREAGVPFSDVVADWNFLLHISSLLPEADFKALCAALNPRVRGVVSSSGASAQAAIARCEELLCASVGLAQPGAQSKGKSRPR